MKDENFSADKKGKREYLDDSLTRGLVKGLERYFRSKVEIPRIRVEERQEIETLTSEEALLFAQYLRNERKKMESRARLCVCTTNT